MVNFQQVSMGKTIVAQNKVAWRDIISCPVPGEQDPSSHPLRLHRLRINRREDSSILCAGRAFLPASNQTSIHQWIHRPLS